MKKKKTISDQCTVWALCGPEIYEKRKKKNWKNEKGKKKKTKTKKPQQGDTLPQIEKKNVHSSLERFLIGKVNLECI